MLSTLFLNIPMYYNQIPHIFVSPDSYQNCYSLEYEKGA